jgi:hypothetical protein
MLVVLLPCLLDLNCDYFDFVCCTILGLKSIYL